MHYAIFPATGSKGLWILIPALIVLVGALALLGRTLWGSRHATFELDEQGLSFHGDVWGHQVPLAELRGGAARIVDLRNTPDLSPRRRTMGTALPNYQSGWFRLANGEKALLYLTRRDGVVYIPTTAGYSILLSPAEPDRMLADLRRMAPTS